MRDYEFNVYRTQKVHVTVTADDFTTAAEEVIAACKSEDIPWEGWEFDKAEVYDADNGNEVFLMCYGGLSQTAFIDRED